MTTKKTLICFTASYPFGLKETFFHNELPFLADSFDEVVIFPRYNPSGSNQKREVPTNVTVVEPFVASNKAIRFIQGVLNFSPLRFHIREFFKKKIYKSQTSLMTWFNSLLVFRRSYSRLSSYLKNADISPNTVMYSYWAETPLFLASLCKPHKKVVRMHRGDYYLE